MVLAADAQLRLDANWVDYLIVALYFVFVIGIAVHSIFTLLLGFGRLHVSVPTKVFRA